MKRGLLSRALDLQEGEQGRVILLLIMSFFMGAFLATFTVAAQTLFLNNFDEKNDLPGAFAIAGVFGIVATISYNFLQRKIRFQYLAVLSLLVVTAVTAAIEFGDLYFPDKETIYYFGFTQLIPFTLIVLLVFLGGFQPTLQCEADQTAFGYCGSGRIGGIVDLIFCHSRCDAVPAGRKRKRKGGIALQHQPGEHIRLHGHVHYSFYPVRG